MTIPQHVRRRLVIEPGSEVDFEVYDDAVRLVRLSEGRAAAVVATLRGRRLFAELAVGFDRIEDLDCAPPDLVGRKLCRGKQHSWLGAVSCSTAASAVIAGHHFVTSISPPTQRSSAEPCSPAIALAIWTCGQHWKIIAPN